MTLREHQGRIANEGLYGSGVDLPTGYLNVHIRVGGDGDAHDPKDGDTDTAWQPEGRMHTHRRSPIASLSDFTHPSASPSPYDVDDEP